MYVMNKAMKENRIPKKAGCFPCSLDFLVSESQAWTAKDIAAQPIVRFRMYMAAIGSIEEIVDETSVSDESLASGGVYGTIKSGRRISLLDDIFVCDVTDRKSVV